MKLTLRDLFWCLAIVAMGCAWWVDSSQVRRERNQAVMDRMVLEVVAESDLPWMVGVAGLSEDARADFNEAYHDYRKASPEEQERMKQSAMALMAGLESDSP